MLEAALRDYVADPEQSDKLLRGIDRVLSIAIGGEDKDAISAMKLLLDRVMPAMPPKEQEEAGKSITRLQVVILTNPDAKTPVQVTVDGECTNVEDTQ